MKAFTINLTQPDGSTIPVECDGNNAVAVMGGQRVSLALQPQDVHDPSEIPTYLAGYSPFMYRADEASGIVLVDQDEDKFRQFNSDDAFRSVVVKGSTQGAVPEVDPKSALESYKVVERYVGAFIPQQTQANASNPNYDPRRAAASRCSRALQLDREVDVWGLLGTSGNWDSNVVTAVGGGSEWDTASGDPILDIQTAIEKSFQPVTEIWMNQKVAHAFLRNPNVRNHMRQMLGDSPVPPAVGTVPAAGEMSSDFVIPGLKPIRVVASKIKNEATGALDYVLGDVAVLITKPPSGVPTSGEEIASTYTFRRRGPSGTGFEVREFFVPGRGPLGGTMIVVSQADQAVFTANNAGGIITNVHT